MFSIIYYHYYYFYVIACAEHKGKSMLLNASVNVNGPLRFKHDVWAKGWVCMHVQLWIIVLLYGIAVGLFFVCDTEYFSFSSVWSLMLLLFFSMENKLCLNLFTSSYHFGYRCYMNKYMISTSEKKDFFPFIFCVLPKLQLPGRLWFEIIRFR